MTPLDLPLRRRHFPATLGRDSSDLMHGSSNATPNGQVECSLISISKSR